MSNASKITTYLTGLKPAEDYTPLNVEEMASALSMNRTRLVKQLSSLGSKGKVEWVKEDPDHPRSRIIGFRNLNTVDGRKNRRRVRAVAPAESNGAATAEPRPIRRLVHTPELDRIHEARSAMQEFVERFPGIVDAARVEEAIHIDPEKAGAYAQEGMSLLERNRWLETRNSELRSRVHELERENGFLKTRNDQKLRDALQTAGVVHSNPED